MAEDFQVLVVCTANQCRSPMAEFLLREAMIDYGLNWQVGSAGTHAVPGLPMQENTARLLNSRGIPVGGWQTRPVDAAMMDEADVILTAARQHRSLLITARPDLRSKTFPLLRFARLAEHARETNQWRPDRDPATVLMDVVGRAELGGQADDDLSDPVGKPYRKYKHCATVLDHAIAQIFGH